MTTDFAGDDDQGAAVAIQGDGKIMATGTVLGVFDFALARYNPDGSLDPTFDGNGRMTTDFGSNDQAFAMAIQGNGKIVVAGTAIFSSFDFAVARYNPDGSTGTVDFALARYNPDGSLDPTFSGGRVTTDFAGAGDQAFGAAIQGDGKIVAAGFAFVSGTRDFALARYNSDGSLDPTYDGDGRVTTDFAGGNDQAAAVVIQGDGNIVAGGVAAISGVDDFALARYKTDGSLDTIFSGDGKITTDFAGGGDQARGVAIQGDRKILAAGSAAVSGNDDFALARYTVCRRTSRPSSIPFCP